MFEFTEVIFKIYFSQEACFQDIKVGDKVGLKDLRGNDAEANGKNAIVKELLPENEYRVDCDGDMKTVHRRNITDPYLEVIHINKILLYFNTEFQTVT